MPDSTHESLGEHITDLLAPLGASTLPVPLVTTDPVDVDRSITVHRHADEKVRGGRTFVDQSTSTDETLTGSFDNHVKELIDGQIRDVMTERETRENIRANKRNFNRMLTLLGALVIGLIVTFVLTTPGIIPTEWKFLTPYTFVITIVLDAGLAVYGYVKKY